MSAFTKVAISNRGEIAKRVISTCQQMGLQTVLLHAQGDTQSEAFRLADETICIGSSDLKDSYLNIENNITGALAAGAQAIHPGYGFLSESSEFSHQCQEKGLSFIGPSAETIKLFGNKIEALKTCKKVGVPTLPHWIGDTENKKLLLEKARDISYPLMIKAASGGGGRGLRLASNEEELKRLVPIVRSEALASFNNKEIFIEKYLEAAKHIEVQIFVSADKKVFILGDRDCSVQRRHQKIIETAPSGIPNSIKKQMYEVSKMLCESIDYQGAGTIEFLFHQNHFYFLEMNTRLQVEHTITEMIFGIDLVRAQILTAMNQPAFLKDQDFSVKGYSLQCRICAEDPSHQFLPSIGTLLHCSWPQGFGKRVDTGFQAKDTISLQYDSLIAKVISWDTNRTRAIDRMKKALEETIIFGLTSNIPFLQSVLSHPLFLEDQIMVDSIEKTIFPEWKFDSCPIPDSILNSAFKKLKNTSSDSHQSSEKTFNPWADFEESQ